MFLCSREERKAPLKSCCTSESLKKNKDEKLHNTHTPLHAKTHRNSTDRDGNKITGGFGGKTNQRDMKGEREAERQRW